MTRTKFTFSIILAAVFLVSQIITAGAAPATQETTPITGTVQSINLETDAGITTVVVELTDNNGETQTVRLSIDYANELHLLDESGEPVDPESLQDPISIDAEEVIPDAPEETGQEAQHPVGSKLADFFSEILGVNYDTIMEYHNDDGVGFGVIAQALWITNALKQSSETEMTQEDTSKLFAAILDAKQSHDYGDITLPDGSTPENWGQFRKAVLHDREKAKENLGAIMSGRADNGQGEQLQNQEQNQEQIQMQNEVHGNGNAPDKNNDKSNNGKGPDKNKSNNGKGKGNNH